MSGPAAVTAVNEDGRSPYVLLCEHASNAMPARYAGLGLNEADLGRHIAWDIGAAGMARHLSRLLDAPLFLSGYSRLLIDCNRPPLSETSIPTRSEDTDIPGNQGLTDEERALRARAFFQPFQERVTAALDRRQAERRLTAVIGVHSFTPVFRGLQRSWRSGVLYAAAAGFAQAFRAALEARTGTPVGDNEPYRVGADTDYTVPVHGDQRGIAAALIEVRQDLLADGAGMEAWAGHVAAALPDTAALQAFGREQARSG